MIEVSRSKESIRICGHAGYADHGQDIVCAAVTALAQTLIMSVEELTDDEIQYEISPGRAEIHHRDLSEAGKLFVDSFFIGIDRIAEAFPQNVHKKMTEMS